MPPRYGYLPHETKQLSDQLAFDDKTSRDMWNIAFEQNANATINNLGSHLDTQQPQQHPIPMGGDGIMPQHQAPIANTPLPDVTSLSTGPSRAHVAEDAANEALNAPPQQPTQLTPMQPIGQSSSSVTSTFTPGSAPTAAGPSSAPPIAGSNPEAQARVYQRARASGLDDEAARVLVAVSETEGGTRGAVGDNGQSRGVYQFHEQGEMPAFRRWVAQNGIQGDPNQLAVDPDIATRYAAEGYLGQAIARGRQLGYTGADLATYVQRTGQRSVDPARTGQNYTRLFADQPATAEPVQATPTSPTQRASESRAQSGETRLQGITPPQFGLGDADAESICGPVLALAFAKSTGRNPTIAEAKQMAAQNGGWTSAQGMGGPEAMARTLRSMDIPAHYAPGALDVETIRQETQNGNPVGINTRGHYFVVEGVDEQGRLDLGNSAKALRASGGRQWFKPEEIAGLGMGAPTGAIYKDSPASPTPSVAVKQTGMPPAAPTAAPPQAAGSPAPVAAPPPAAAGASDMVTIQHVDSGRQITVPTSALPGYMREPAPGVPAMWRVVDGGGQADMRKMSLNGDPPQPMPGSRGRTTRTRRACRVRRCCRTRAGSARTPTARRGSTAATSAPCTASRSVSRPTSRCKTRTART
jgi:hypothetical protein